MSKFSTILWDLDGTIIDSSPGVFASFHHTFQTLGLPDLSDEQMRPFMGPPLAHTFGDVLGYDAELVQECLKTYRNYYLNHGGALDATVYPGVIETLQRIKEAGIPQSLATSKALVGTTLVGEHFDFLKYFDVLGTASNDLSRHSKSQVLDYALNELQKTGADLTKPLLIGDRIFDVDGAREHGIAVCLVKWGFGTEDEFARADYLVSTSKELLELLGLAH
jgi:phosphoglycolate phosphatase